MLNECLKDVYNILFYFGRDYHCNNTQFLTINFQTILLSIAFVRQLCDIVCVKVSMMNAQVKVKEKKTTFCQIVIVIITFVFYFAKKTTLYDSWKIQ
jgi:hypothetical protein